VNPWYFLGPWLGGIIPLMRPIYGRLRAFALAQHKVAWERDYHGYGRYRQEFGQRQIDEFYDEWAIWLGIGGFALATIWPVLAAGKALMIVGHGFGWWMNGTRYQSPIERDLQLKAREERIKQLEIENGIQPPERDWSPW
jgi:hypothetical protein